MKEQKYSSGLTQILPPVPLASDQTEQMQAAYLQAEEFAVSPKIGWWYRLTTPGLVHTV